MRVLLLVLLVGVAGCGSEPDTVTRQKIANFEKAVKFYRIVNKDWPEGNTEEVVTLLMKGEDKQGKPRDIYLQTPPVDVWDMPLQYQYPPMDNIGVDKPRIWSFGPDRREGTDDDIFNSDRPVANVPKETHRPVTFVSRPRKFGQTKPNHDQQVEPASDRPANRGKDNPTPQTSVTDKLKKMDKNRDGFIDRSEATGPLIREKFTNLDKNGDGRLSRQELKQSLVKLKRRKKRRKK